MAHSSPSEAMHAFGRAAVSGSLDEYTGLVTDGFTYVHSGGRLERKPDAIERISAGRRYLKWDIESMDEAPYAGCTIVTGKANLTRQDPAGPVDLYLQFTGTAVPVDGGWQLAALQTTRLPLSQ